MPAALYRCFVSETFTGKLGMLYAVLTGNFHVQGGSDVYQHHIENLRSSFRTILVPFVWVSGSGTDKVPICVGASGLGATPTPLSQT